MGGADQRPELYVRVAMTKRKHEEKDSRVKHGDGVGDRQKRPRAYRSWLAMRGRVLQKPEFYEHVDSDPRWADYRVFYADMGDCPSGHTIHRVDGNKGYWPDNCVWATRSQQQQAMRKRVPPIGQAYARGMADKMSQAEIAEVLGCGQATVHRIIHGASGFEPKPGQRKFQQHNSLPPLGVAYARGMKGLMSQREIAEVLGCSDATIGRIHNNQHASTRNF
jgi:Trp operon repressor